MIGTLHRHSHHWEAPAHQQPQNELVVGALHHNVFVGMFHYISSHRIKQLEENFIRMVTIARLLPISKHRSCVFTTTGNYKYYM